MVVPRKNRIKPTTRQTKTGLIIIDDTQEELSKIRNIPGLQENFICEEQTKNNSTMIIYGVETGMRNEEIVEAVIKQNFGKGRSEEVEKGIKPKFRTGPRNKKRCHLVIEVTKDIRKELLTRRKVFVYYEALTVKDSVSIPKCYKCQTYGHIERYCDQRQRCDYCDEVDHGEKNRRNKSKKRIYCIPCWVRRKECKARQQMECFSYSYNSITCL